jgi:hypothetical protein
MAQHDTLRLYEALELRAEYDARLKTLKDCLPESRRESRRYHFDREEQSRSRPSPDFDLAQVRQQLKSLEFRRRKLNTAIQEANFQHQVEFGGEPLRLSEALELRKGLNTQLGELHTQLVEAAYQRVIYKEDRDIVEDSERSYSDCAAALEEARLSFRALNRAIRAAAFAVSVDFQDE